MWGCEVWGRCRHFRIIKRAPVVAGRRICGVLAKYRAEMQRKTRVLDTKSVLSVSWASMFSSPFFNGFHIRSVQLLHHVWILRPHGLQHASLPCPSPSSRVCSNSCPLSRWCHPTISSSVVPFSSRLQAFLASGSFPVSWLFTPEYWGFSFSISPSNEYSGLISFRIDWFDFLEVQGTLKSLLQHHTSKASILHHSDFFIGQLSHPYVTTGKTIALTRWTFVGKVMSLLFNMLCRFVIAFLPRSKLLLISRLQ